MGYGIMETAGIMLLKELVTNQFVTLDNVCRSSNYRNSCSQSGYLFVFNMFYQTIGFYCFKLVPYSGKFYLTFLFCYLEFIVFHFEIRALHFDIYVARSVIIN